MKRILLRTCEIAVTTTPSVIETVLGSCVAVCLWDEEKGIGGMNHFMLPLYTKERKDCGCYGTESIRILVERAFRVGASREGTRAKLFGGGKVLKMINERFDVGKENIRAARETLQLYGIPIVNECLGKKVGLKVVFYPHTGRAFVKRLHNEETENQEQGGCGNE